MGLDKFRIERANLESTLDAEVVTTDELSVSTFVSSAQEKLVHFPPAKVVRCKDQIVGMVESAMQHLQNIYDFGKKDIGSTSFDENSKATSLERLTKDFKFFSNYIFGSLIALLELGLYSVQVMEKALLEEVKRMGLRSDRSWYNSDIRDQMVDISNKQLIQVGIGGY